jgi:hypothetical protein
MTQVSKPARLFRLGVVLVACLVSLASVTPAKNFVSFNGQFYLTYPDSWEQIDFRSVDFFLTQNNPNPALLAYEAVFAPTSTRPFYEEPYLLLTFDKIGELIGPTRDSALSSIAAGFAARIDSISRSELLAKIRPDAPLYIPEDRMLAVQTDIHEGRVITRRNLLVVRFSQAGLTSFYFYAPDSVWSAALPVFLQIAQSFTPGTQPPNLAPETLKVADLTKEETPTPSIRRYWPIPSGIVIILIAIMAARRRRRRQSNEQSASQS